MINRIQLGRVVYGCYLIVLFFKLKDGLLLSQQISEPVLTDTRLNVSYWLFFLTNINSIVFNSYFLRVAIDISLFSIALICLVKPDKNIFSLIFAIFIWCYQLLFTSIYIHFSNGILFACLPFIFRNEVKFSIVFNFGRYFLCGLYFLAGCLKVYNGGAFNYIQMKESLRMTVFDYIYYHSTGIKTQIMEFLINNTMTSYILFLLATFLELFFIIGFFTKKYDYGLILLFLLFHSINYLILDLSFINHFIILIFLLPIVKINKKIEGHIIYYTGKH